jgi:WD40 repeat protein
MVKTYLRYVNSNILGQVTGKVDPVVHSSQKIFFTAMNDLIIVFLVKTGKAIQYIKSDLIKTEITFLECSELTLFVGHSCGTILQYKINNSLLKSNYISQDESIITYETKFSLHRASITYLQFNDKENQLLSASQDTNIYLWDIISETVLYKYSGHKDSIIKVSFFDLISSDDQTSCLKLVLSCSKDNTLKIWNRTSQECLQTISNLVNKINYFTVVEDVLILGTYDNKINLYKLAFSVKKQKSEVGTYQIAVLKGSLARQTGAKITSMKIAFQNRLLVVFAKDKSVEFFKILSEKELENRVFINECKRVLKAYNDKAISDKDKENTINTNNNTNMSSSNESFTNNVEEIKEKTSKIILTDDYNFSLKFFSLIKFYEENEILNIFFIENLFSNTISNTITKNNTNTNNNKKTDIVASKYNARFCLTTNTNVIEIYEMSIPCLYANMFKLNKKNITSTIIESKSSITSTSTSMKDINKMLSSLSNPSISEEDIGVKHLFTFDIGHREVIKNVKFSSSNTKFLSVSSDCVRIWNYYNNLEKQSEGILLFDNSKSKLLKPQYPVKKITIEGESFVNAMFIRGDEFILIGSKQGNLHLVDSDSCFVIASINAHVGEISNIVFVKAEGEFYAVTAGTDKLVNYFRLDLDKEFIDSIIASEEGQIISKEEQANKTTNEDNDDNNNDTSVRHVLTFANSLSLSDQSTYMLISPNKKYLCVSLLDNSVRVFYSDSGKQLHSLYGHKLPVLSFDISSDNAMIITGSSDKNVKIWGMDFGDLHKSLFAHHDAVTAVKFVNKTHYFFSASKDGMIKYWDGDAVS